VAIEANGQILVADPTAFGGGGGVIRIDPETGSQTIVSSGGSFVDPIGIAVVPAVPSGLPTVSVAAGGVCGKSNRDGSITLRLEDHGTPEVLLLSVASSNEALVPSRNVVFAGTGAIRTMWVEAVARRSGIAVLTVTVSDGEASSSVEVTVWVGGNGRDEITGGAGADIIFGQNGNDVLAGGAGNDVICGGRGDDHLDGGPGDDALGGGQGDDVLTGGPGADHFSGGQGHDVATDFNPDDGDRTDESVAPIVARARDAKGVVRSTRR
jgi:hypothetical protein